MLETLDASWLMAHAIGPGDRFYIALRRVSIDMAVPSQGMGAVGQAVDAANYSRQPKRSASERET